MILVEGNILVRAEIVLPALDFDVSASSLFSVPRLECPHGDDFPLQSYLAADRNCPRDISAQNSASRAR
jgi:hypothetical protein